MKKYFIYLLISVLFLSFSSKNIFAGNEQRAGQAGAGELLINPWARSSGWGGVNVASIHGLEAMFLNVAGTAFTKSTELIFAKTELFTGLNNGVSLNSFGFSQKVGETGVICMAVTAVNFGEVNITTVENPDGGYGTYSPSYSNIGISYAKEFSNSIYGGVTIKLISESISDLKSSGVAFDAGIQYVTGKSEQIKFGITMKNVGPTVKCEGDGMSLRATPPSGIIMTMEHRSADFELPSLIKIGVAYDLTFGIDHLVTLAGNFTSNSFTRDQFHGGLQYSYKEILILRGGYVHEKEIDDVEKAATMFKGPTAGFSIQIPLNKEKGSTFSFDYSYRDTYNFDGVHSFGVKISM